MESKGEGKVHPSVLCTMQVMLVVKHLPTNAGDLRDTDSIPGSGGSLEESMATHSSVLAWKILWIEKPGGLQSLGLHRVRHN